MSKRLILCDCSGSQEIDSEVIGKACDIQCSRVYSNLCTTQMERAAAEIAKGDAVIACLQEREIFEELGAEIGTEPVDFVDIRDRAGWSDEGGKASAKMAALIAESLLETPPSKSLDITSEGRCLILGTEEIAYSAARKLSEVLSVTVLLEQQASAPTDRSFDVVVGRLRRASGALGNFTVNIDALQQFDLAGRGERALGAPRDGGISECDLILDLRGATPLFPAPQKRDGYFRCDPGDPIAVSDTVLKASQMIGGFEKPFYISVDQPSCAHSRAQIAGCSKCLDICPTSAISSLGDFVSVDPAICAGCGSCAALCPSGAISYDAPPSDFMFKRIETLGRSFRKAGGDKPRLLVHDGDFGGEMISLAARFGRGLPQDVIPMEVSSLSSFGHAEMLAALAVGFVHVDGLLAPKTEQETLQSELALASAIGGKDSFALLDMTDPDQLCETLYGFDGAAQVKEPVLPQGSRRQITRLAAIALNGQPDSPLPLPQNAPYGAVVVDTEACTLCLSCASLCPTGALADNPDMPQLRFQEDACLQCGLCTRVCPENAITLQPQLDLSEGAFDQKVLHEEEPFACVECGALFGVKSTIEKITEKLAGKHAMFANESTSRLIQMCDNCRIAVQYKATDNPFQGGERPRVVTTDDYFSKRRDH